MHCAARLVLVNSTQLLASGTRWNHNLGANDAAQLGPPQPPPGPGDAAGYAGESDRTYGASSSAAGFAQKEPRHSAAVL